MNKTEQDRLFLAGFALQALLANPNVSVEWAASKAVRATDALMKELSKEKDDA